MNFKILTYIYFLSFYCSLQYADADSLESTSLGPVDETSTQSASSLEHTDEASTQKASSELVDETSTQSASLEHTDEASTQSPSLEQTDEVTTQNPSLDTDEASTQKTNFEHTEEATTQSVNFKNVNKAPDKNIKPNQEDFYQKALELHNALRARHPGTPPMSLDKAQERSLPGDVGNLNLAAYWCAVQYVRFGVSAYCKDKMNIKCKDGKMPGENSAYYNDTSPGTSPVSLVERAIKEFYGEKSKFNYNNPNGEAKHYSQMVWASSTILGVGIASLPRGEFAVSFMYCNAGNEPTKVKDNVKPTVLESSTSRDTVTCKPCAGAGMAISPAIGLVLFALKSVLDFSC